jgi:hypothetical protein
MVPIGFILAYAFALVSMVKPPSTGSQFEIREQARQQLAAVRRLYEDDPTPENETFYMENLQRFAALVLASEPFLGGGSDLCACDSSNRVR